MKYFLMIFLLLTNLVASDGSNAHLHKSKHTKKDTIVSIAPVPDQLNVSPYANIEITFSVDLDQKQIKRYAIRVRRLASDKKKKHGKKIDVEGHVNYDSQEKKLSFRPSRFLQPGLYKVEINAIKASKKNKHHNIKNLSYRFSVADIHPLSLKIVPSAIEVKEGGNLDLQTVVLYDDNSQQVIKDNVVYKSTDASIVNIETNATATGLKEGTTRVVSTYKGLASSTVDAVVYLEICEHRLPPEPDQAINNSTLLGIDSNDNGVRDDVERWIYFKYQNEHPIHIDIAMQAGRAWQKVLEDPTKAKEIYPLIDAASSCEAYYEVCINKNSELFISNEIINKFFIEHLIFNTSSRTIAFLKYDKLLSEDSYTIPRCGIKKALCGFNTSKYGE